MPRGLRVALAWSFGAASTGCVLAALFAAIDARLHHDLANGDRFLLALRFRDALAFSVPAGAFGFLFLGLAAEALRRRRWPYAAGAGAVAVAGLWSVRLAAWQFLMRDDWMRRREVAAWIAAFALLGAIAAGAHAIRRRPFRAALALGAAPFALAGALAAFALPLAANRRASGLPDVVLVSLDTVRADRMGFNGYARATTPRLDALAAEGVVLEQAHSAAPWTLPSHASLFTALEPGLHGTVRRGHALRPGERTLAEAFREAGYRTGAFTGGGYVSWGYGLGQGFEAFVDHDEPNEGGPAAVVASARRWLAGTGSAPVFLFLHTYEPHAPYTHDTFADPSDRGRLPRSRSEGLPDDDTPTPSERRYISDLYDGDIRACDDTIGAFLETYLRERSRETILVVTSDHGEDVWDHDALEHPRHGHTLYQDQLRVPLFVRAPGRLPTRTRIATPVSLLDVAPTLAELAGVRWSPASGRSLASDLAAGREPERRPIFAEATRYGPARFALREGDLKAILTPKPDEPVERDVVRAVPLEAFDLALDPSERHDLSGTPDAALRALVSEILERSRRKVGDAARPTFVPDDELLRQLRSLGYVDAPGRKAK